MQKEMEKWCKTSDNTTRSLLWDGPQPVDNRCQESNDRSKHVYRHRNKTSRTSEFGVEVKNRFKRLQLGYREQEELWSDIRDIVKETADKRVPQAKRKKVTKWLSDQR